MGLINISELEVVERLPGWRGRFFHSAEMTFAHYEFACGASIHEHSHAQEEVYQVIEGELRITIAGVVSTLRPGTIAIVPAEARHSVEALSDGRVLIVDCPRRPEFE
jgi:quercetin dioxygenase-like cupin family protein